MLEVPYERSVRSLAEEVEERPRGSLFLAVGRSAEVRAAVEAALEERGITVARVTLRDDEGPWWRMLETLKESESPDGSKVLLSVAGLGDMAEDKLDRILQHLNLGRELRVINRLHVLLWVGGLDGLDRLRTGASDVWGHRSGVELFLSSEDFEVAFADLGPGEVPRDMEALLHETEVDLALSRRPPHRIELLTGKANYLQELGRVGEAMHAVEDAEDVLAKWPMSPRDQADAQARVVQARLALLVSLGRTEDALSYAMSMGQSTDGDPMLRHAVQSRLAAVNMSAGRVTESLASYADALKLALTVVDVVCGRGADLLNRAHLYSQQGAFDAALRDARSASEEVERLRHRNEQNEAFRPLLLSDADGLEAMVCFEQGDTPRALEHAHRRVTWVVGAAAKRLAQGALVMVADIYRRLGLIGDARRFARRAIELLEHSPGDIAWWTRWLGARDADEHQIDASIARYESAVALYRIAASADRGPHRRAPWLREAAAVLYTDLAPLADNPTAARHFSAAEELLTLAAQAADEAASPEQQALIRHSRASLATARRQWDTAETELLAFLTWAEANWGPYKRAEVLLDLARIARERGDLPHAASYAERAQREVAIDPPEYMNRFTAIAAARELARIRKAEGDVTAAHAALSDAIGIAEGDKLRLREREVRIDLADLPPRPGAPDDRIEHAQRARTIAQDAAFPVDEAEAMLVLAELHLETGAARRAQALFDQAAWIVDRIGPAAVRDRASRVRAKLGG